MTLAALAQQIKQATDIQQNRSLLHDQMQADLLLTHNNHLFCVTQQLIAFLHAWNESTLILPDMYGNPVQVQRESLLTECKSQYQRVLNRWHMLHEELQHVRKI